MREIVGLALGEERIDCVVARRGLAGARALHAFSLGVGDDMAAALRAKLSELGVRTSRVHVGIPRRRAVVKVLELPAVAGADLRRMVGFELERHLPFPASDAIFDFHVLDQAPGRPIRVLLVAVERRVFEWVQGLLRNTGLTPRLIDVAIHSLAVLVARSDGEPRDGAVVVHVAESEAELAVVRRGQPILSRAFPLPGDAAEPDRTLGEELRRSLASLGPDDRAAVAEVVVTGARVPATAWAGLPARTEITLPPGLTGPGSRPPFLLALAAALRHPVRGRLRTNLMPDELRPRPFPWRVAATVALAVLTLLLGLAIPVATVMRGERRLAAVNHALDQLGPEVRQVEQLVSAVQRARRELETLQGFEAQHVRVLPILRELTEVLPPDVWLTNLSVDRKGVELAGFAAAASQLIPLLEASPILEAVEFISPVTKGRDREQFRLKAAWERSAQPAGARRP